MIARRGAAGEQELRHRHLGRDPNHLRSEACPDRVEPLEPGEELGVLDLWNRPGERLVHVVVGVDEPGQDQVTAGVNHLVGGARQRLGRSHGLDPVAPYEHRGALELAPLLVKCGHAGGIANRAASLRNGEAGGGALGGRLAGVWRRPVIVASKSGSPRPPWEANRSPHPRRALPRLPRRAPQGRAAHPHRGHARAGAELRPGARAMACRSPTPASRRCARPTTSATCSRSSTSTTPARTCCGRAGFCDLALAYLDAGGRTRGAPRRDLL